MRPETLRASHHRPAVGSAPSRFRRAIRLAATGMPRGAIVSDDPGAQHCHVSWRHSIRIGFHDSLHQHPQRQAGSGHQHGNVPHKRGRSRAGGAGDAMTAGGNRWQDWSCIESGTRQPARPPLFRTTTFPARNHPLGMPRSPDSLPQPEAPARATSDPEAIGQAAHRPGPAS